MNKYRVEYGVWGIMQSAPLLVREDGQRWILFVHPTFFWPDDLMAVCDADLLNLIQRDMDARLVVQEYYESIKETTSAAVGRLVLEQPAILNVHQLNDEWDNIVININDQGFQWNPVPKQEEA